MRDGFHYLLQQIIDSYKISHGYAKDMSLADIHEAIAAEERIAADLPEDMKKTADEAIIRHKQMAGNVGQLAGFMDRDYFPMMRFGDRGVTVKKRNPKTGKMDLAAFLTFETTGMSKPGWKQRATDTIDIEEIIAFDRLAELLNKGEGEQYIQMRDKVLELLLERGFAKSLKESNMIPGYSHDANRALGTYAATAANFASKATHAREISDALGQINPAQQGELYDYAQRFVNYKNSLGCGMLASCGTSVSTSPQPSCSGPLFPSLLGRICLR
jgi:hypothetical protein